MNKLVKIIINFVLCILILFFAIQIMNLFIKNKKEPAKIEEVKEFILPVRTEKLVPIDIDIYATGYGNVQPRNIINLYPEVSGRLINVSKNFKVGGIIKKGEEIYSIEKDRYINKINQISSQIEQAKSELENLLQEEKNLLEVISILDERYKLTKEQTDRIKSLIDQGGKSKDELDLAEMNVLTQKELVQKQKNLLNVIPMRKKNQKAKLNMLDSQLKDAQLDLNRTVYISEFNSRVSEVNIEKGEYLERSRKIGQIIPIDAVEIPVALNNGDIKFIFNHLVKDLRENKDSNMLDIFKKVKLPAKVIWSASGKDFEWDGYVARSNYQVDPKTRMITFIVEVKNPYKNVYKGEPPLWLGMFCKVKIFAEKLENVFKVPRYTIHTDNTIFIAKDNKVSFVKTDVLEFIDDYAIVKTGLVAGDKLIMTPITSPVPGMKIQIFKSDT